MANVNDIDKVGGNYSYHLLGQGVRIAYFCHTFFINMKERRDIANRTDVEFLVNEFYGKVQKDLLIGPIFIGVIGDNWQPHLEKMYKFWSSILLGENSYSGRPFPPHAQMPIQLSHFENWLALFTQTVDENFEGPLAEEAKMRARNMAQMFYYKIEALRGNPHQRSV